MAEGYTPFTWADNVTVANATRMQAIENGVRDARLAHAGTIGLDSFTGASDNAKLTSAMSYAAAQTYKPLIELGNRSHSFTGSLGQPYNGFGLVGSGRGWLNAEQGIRHCNVQLTASGAWIDNTGGQAWNYYFEGIDWTTGNTTTQWMRSAGSNAIWAMTGRDLTFQGFNGVLGNGSEKFVTDLCTFNGGWEILSCYDTPINIGGGDNRELWSDGGNIGSGSIPSGGGASKFLFRFNGNSKATIGPLYITADNGWRGLISTGSSSSGFGQHFRGLVVEGRNPGDPCHGNLIRVEGGSAFFYGLNVNSGMASPTSPSTSSVNPNGTTDRGLIEVVGTDTQVDLDGVNFSHATGVAVTTPCVYVAGTAGAVMVTARAFHTSTRSGSPSWGSQLPVIKQSVTGLVVANDATMALSVG